MKSRLTLIGTMAAACAVFQLAAMPTEEETKRAEPVVKKLMASERAALKSGKKTRSEVAAAAMKLADEADTDTAKLLLMKGAFVLYVKDGNLEKAAETMKALEAAISDMPPQSVTNMIEIALLGVRKKEDGARLYKLLDEPRLFDKQTATFLLAPRIDLEMIKCPAGEFMMGYESWKTWGSSLNREQRKLHRVKLTKDFMLGKFPVTYSQWYAIMGNGKKAPKGLEDTPVGNITVLEMEAFCEKLTAKFKARLGGKVFRLPTDAEWEYASKGGKNLDGLLGKTPGRNGNTGSSSRDGKEVEAIFKQMGYTGDDHARVSDTNKPYFMWKTLPVGKHKPNEWGFMDFIGNAWEVTADKMMDFKENLEFHKNLRRWNGRQGYRDFEIDPLLKGERRLIRTGFWDKGVSSIGNKNSIGDNDRFPAVGFRICIGEPLGDWNNAKVADQQRVEAERQPQNEEEKLKREAEREREQQREALLQIKEELRRQREAREEARRLEQSRRNDRSGFRDGHPMKLSTEEKLRELKTANGSAGVRASATEKTEGAFALNAVPGSVTKLDLGNVPPLQFVYCPAGKFSMGYKEQPALSKVKEVEITSPFWISKTLIRADQLKSLGLDSVTNTPFGAAMIADASIVVQKLPSALKERFGKMLPPGYVFRLPTEAEFEYLQKAGTKEGDDRRKWGHREDEDAPPNIWGVERLFGSKVSVLDRAPAYGKGGDVVNRRSRGTAWTDLEKVSYENQPDKDPIGWTDDHNWSVFRRQPGTKLLTRQRYGNQYSFYIAVAPDVDKLNKFYWK